jgi:uncharacterized membrane protein
MTQILEHLYKAMAFAFALAVLFFLARHLGAVDHSYGQFVFRWLHVISGILWIGLLWYFNMVQAPTMPKIPAELKPGVSKYIAPEALFWFRWSALATVVTGLLLAWANGYLVSALIFQMPTIGVGMWLGLIMAFNVWFIIWPNQQRALGLVQADDATKARSARVAALTSRVNFVLSVPMLYGMVGQQNIG